MLSTHQVNIVLSSLAQYCQKAKNTLAKLAHGKNASIDLDGACIDLDGAPKTETETSKGTGA